MNVSSNTLVQQSVNQETVSDRSGLCYRVSQYKHAQCCTIPEKKIGVRIDCTNNPAHTMVGHDSPDTHKIYYRITSYLRRPIDIKYQVHSTVVCHIYTFIGRYFCVSLMLIRFLVIFCFGLLQQPVAHTRWCCISREITNLLNRCNVLTRRFFLCAVRVRWIVFNILPVSARTWNAKLVYTTAMFLLVFLLCSRSNSAVDVDDILFFFFYLFYGHQPEIKPVHDWLYGAQREACRIVFPRGNAIRLL